MDDELSRLIDAHVNSALWECCPSSFIEKLRETNVISRAKNSILSDAMAFSRKDPAAGNDALRVLNSYTSFRAVLHHRIANALLMCSNLDEALCYASILSSRGKFLSGAEIHPNCQIGARFILDHGVGTVIGETADIGDDCYILGGVTIGALGVSDNPSCKRHPTLGHRVQVGAYSTVLGNIHIGDDVFIGSNCVVTESIPAKSRVKLKSSVQVCSHSNRTAVQVNRKVFR